ncbi:MAG: disulfide reductase, partial [Clostridiales bacterium]|nr:disulfide reductase [Clostridiales bacterium]
GYAAIGEKSLAQEKCNTIMASAVEKGAEAMITACPLCMYNLETNSTEQTLPVYYFTELLAEALGVK